MNYEYRKKPVVIEAFQMTLERRWDNSKWPIWLHKAWQLDCAETGSMHPVVLDVPEHKYPDMLNIRTLEGLHIVSWDDFIIRGVQGEIYPCKPDIFKATYEGVSK